MVRVLMIGPQLYAPGGIATLARRVLEAASDRADLVYLPTTSRGGGPRKVAAAARASKRLLATLKQHRPEVAHVHVGGGASLLRKAALVAQLRAHGVPVVLHAHFAGAVTSTPHRVALRALVSASTRVVALSRAQREILQPLAGDALVLIPNGVPVEEFIPLGPAGGPPAALFLGGDDPRKGWEDLRDALQHLPPGGILRVAGAGIESVEPHLPGSVENLGSLGSEALLEALQDADIFLLPSRAEGLPLALLEAMSCGLACIATRCDGMVDAIEDGVTGLLVPPRDPRALAAAWARLNSDPALRQRLGSAARATVLERFDQREQVDRLVGLWRAAAGHPSAPA